MFIFYVKCVVVIFLERILVYRGIVPNIGFRTKITLSNKLFAMKIGKGTMAKGPRVITLLGWAIFNFP